MEAPRLRVTLGALRCFTIADLRRDLTRLFPALERRLITRSRFRTTHRSWSIWLNGSGREWDLVNYACNPSYLFRVTPMSALGQKQTLRRFVREAVLERSASGRRAHHACTGFGMR